MTCEVTSSDVGVACDLSALTDQSLVARETYLSTLHQVPWLITPGPKDTRSAVSLVRGAVPTPMGLYINACVTLAMFHRTTT